MFDYVGQVLNRFHSLVNQMRTVMLVRNAFFIPCLLLILLSFNTIKGQEEIQLDTSECIRKKGNIKQLFYKDGSVGSSAPSTPPDFTLFLLGDAGNPHCAEAVNSHLYSKLLKHETESAVIFLGDNVYPNGVPYKSVEKKKIAHAKLEVHLNELVGYSHRAYFLAGNHDYHKAFKSPKRIIAQQQLISSFNQKSKGEITYRPVDQAGDMIELIELDPRIGLIAMDSEWAIKKINKRKKIKRLFREPLLNALKQSKKYEYLIIAAHHPMYTVGDHGHEKLFIASEDLHRKKYRKFIREIVPNLPSGVKIIYAAGHDHSIQYIKLDKFTQIISGSGSKSNHIIESNIPSDSLAISITNRLADSKFMKKRSLFETALKNLEFATNYKGYVQLEFYHKNGGEVWMKVMALEDDVKQVYSNRLY